MFVEPPEDAFGGFSVSYLLFGLPVEDAISKTRICLGETLSAFSGRAKTFLRVSLQRILGRFLGGRGGVLAPDVPILYNQPVGSADE